MSWIDWDLDEGDRNLIEFTRRLIALRTEHPSLRRPKFFQGRNIRGTEIRDLTWLCAEGTEVTDDQWDDEWMRTVGMLLAGGTLDVIDEQGNPLVDDTLLILLNANDDAIPFTMPDAPGILDEGRETSDKPTDGERAWEVLIDTSSPPHEAGSVNVHPGDPFELQARTLALFRWCPSIREVMASQ